MYILKSPLNLKQRCRSGYTQFKTNPTIVASGVCSIVSDGPVYRSLNAYWPTGGRKSLILYLSLTAKENTIVIVC